MSDRATLEREVLALAASADARPIFVAAYGIDRHDRIRAAFGYDRVAQLVTAIAGRIAAARPDWRLARVSDDVISAAFQALDDAEALQLAQAVREEAQGSYTLGEFGVDVRLTVGLSVAGPPRALIREADIALDAARAARRPLCIFDPSAHAAVADTLALMPELRSAMAQGQLSLAHQPKYDMRSGQVTGVESLVRWTHPERGAISPASFVPMAEETGDIAELTRWVLERAVLEQGWLAAEGYPLPFAVNLSGRLLGDRAFIDWLTGRIAASGARLQLEITETAVIDDPAQAFANVRSLAAAGVGCSIDDYGAGLSSLAYLKQIEADELKLDKSLIDDVARSQRDRLVTRSTIDLAHSLGMKVVAEGIEDAETAAILAAMGCDVGQGYHFCRPAPLADLLAFLRETAPLAEAPEPAEPSEPPVEQTALFLRSLSLPRAGGE